jgi:hypothetical protein
MAEWYNGHSSLVSPWGVVAEVAFQGGGRRAAVDCACSETFIPPPPTPADAHATQRAMNEPRAVLAHTDHDTAHSPQRKKVRRQKYAPKACMRIPIVPQ